MEAIMRTHHIFSALLACTAFVATQPTASVAQAPTGQLASEEAFERAQRLEADAWGILNCQPVNYRKAARLFQQAAASRAFDDRRALENLRMAGLLAYYGKDLRRSRSIMAERAERALRLGEVHEAADAYIDAAFLAVELRDGPAAVGYAENARLLADSPLLSVAQRDNLSHRLGVGRVTVASGGDGVR
jgi:hypothetical protein